MNNNITIIFYILITASILILLGGYLLHSWLYVGITIICIGLAFLLQQMATIQLPSILLPIKYKTITNTAITTSLSFDTVPYATVYTTTLTQGNNKALYSFTSGTSPIEMTGVLFSDIPYQCNLTASTPFGVSDTSSITLKLSLPKKVSSISLQKTLIDASNNSCVFSYVSGDTLPIVINGTLTPSVIGIVFTNLKSPFTRTLPNGNYSLVLTSSITCIDNTNIKVDSDPFTFTIP